VLDEKLGKEVVARRHLEKELSEVNARLHQESSEHDTLRTAVGLVLNDFEMTSELGMSLLAVRWSMSRIGCAGWRSRHCTLACSSHSRSRVLITRTSTYRR
jgi:hypothetical protein